jgi:cyclopropane fatty-acyl-phospholipid synthase-like methyltransferase
MHRIVSLVIKYCLNGLDDASGYSKAREKIHPSDALHQDLLAQMEFEAGQEILDFGCGDGTLLTRYLLPLAKEHDFSIVGFDISKQMIDLAKETHPNPRVEYILGDLFSEDTGIVGKKFDGIVSTWVLDYFADYG